MNRSRQTNTGTSIRPRVAIGVAMLVFFVAMEIYYPTLKLNEIARDVQQYHRGYSGHVKSNYNNAEMDGNENNGTSLDFVGEDLMESMGGGGGDNVENTRTEDVENAQDDDSGDIINNARSENSKVEVANATDDEDDDDDDDGGEVSATNNSKVEVTNATDDEYDDDDGGEVSVTNTTDDEDNSNDDGDGNGEDEVYLAEDSGDEEESDRGDQDFTMTFTKRDGGDNGTIVILNEDELKARENKRRRKFNTWFDNEGQLIPNADDKDGPILDFAVVGMPKCGTTTVMANLAQLAPMPIRDICIDASRTVKNSYKNWYREHDGQNKTLHGTKCPQYIQDDWLVEFSEKIPQTKLIMGIRHPVSTAV